MKKYIQTAKEIRENVGKYYVDNLDIYCREGEQVARRIVKDNDGNIWGHREGYKPVILAWHSWDDDREYFTSLEIVKNPSRKRFTIIEIVSILLSIPFVLSFLLFYLVGIMLMYIAVFIRTGNVIRALYSIREYLDTGKLNFTGK